MPLMIVTSNMLAFQGMKHPTPANYAKGSIIDATDEEAAELKKDGNADPAPEGAKLSNGIPIIVDPVERDIREKNFEAAKGSIHKPDNADSLKTPLVGTTEGLAMAHRAASVPAEPMPGSKSEV